MRATTKKSIDLVVPSLLAFATGGYFIYKKEDRSVKFLIMVMVLVFILVYAVTTQVTKQIVIASEKPDPVPLTGDKSNTVASEDASKWADRVQRDVDTIFAFRDSDLYEALVKMSNDDLINIWNSWNKRHYDEMEKTMTQAIDDELPLFFTDARQNMRLVVDRLRGLGCR